MIKNTTPSTKPSFTVVNASSEQSTTILNKSAASLEVTKVIPSDTLALGDETVPSLTIEPVQIVQLSTSTPSSPTHDITVITSEQLTQAKEKNIITDLNSALLVPKTVLISEAKKPLSSVE